MKFFINNSRLVLLIILSIVFLGIRGILNLNRESIPPVDFARAIITTVYPGSSPAEVEELITNKIEDEIRSTEGLKDVVSLSQNGMSLIYIRIDIDNSNAEKIINELHRSMQNVKDLPQEVLNPPQLEHITASNNRPMLHLIITGPDRGRKREEIAFQLKTRIEKLSGVSEVHLNHYRKREFQILLSAKEMERHHVSLMDVTQAVRKQTVNVPAGYLESKTQRHLVRLIGKAKEAKELENIIIRSNFSGQKVFVKDVGRVIDGVEKELSRQYFYQTEKGKPFGLSLSTSVEIMKSEKIDTLSLVSEIQNIIRRFEENIEPGYQIQTFHSEGEKTRQRLLVVVNNALMGFVFVFIIFLLFLPFRVGLMAGLSLPLSILATFAFLPFMGVTFNVITMLAFVICVGMLVDNSVVITECHDRLMENQDISSKKASLIAVQRFLKPITATVLTTIAAFLPMLVTTGVMGEFIKWIPLVVSLALLMSLFESFFLLPSRLQWLSHSSPMKYQSALLNFLKDIEEKFQFLLERILKRKYIGVAFIGLLFAFAVVVNHLGNKLDLFASRSPEFYTAFLEAQPNTPLPVMDKKIRDISSKIYETIGPENLRRLVVENNSKTGHIIASVKPSVLKKLNYKKTLENLRTIDKEDLKKLRFGVIVPGPPSGKPLKLVIQSDSRQQIKSFIDEIYSEVKEIPGILNLEIDPEPEVDKEYRIQLNRESLSRLGLDFSKAGQTLRTALEGYPITELRDQGESFYIRVKYDERELSSLESLKQIRLREPFGRLIPLNQVAGIVETKSEPNRKKYNFQPALVLQAEVDETKTTSFELNRVAKKNCR